MSSLRALLLLLCALPALAQPAGTAARVVAWQPHPGQEAAFFDGYRRHLAWHRAQRDGWTWRGWVLVSGDRTGAFVDGSFFHPWSELDAPVDPAGDSADNRAHVEPFARVTSVQTLEAVGPGGEACLDSPLLTFAWLTVAPEETSGLEAAALKLPARPCAVLLRPVNGGAQHLLLLGAGKLSELPSQATLLRELARAASAGGRRRLLEVRTELGRLREDLCYRPGPP